MSGILKLNNEELSKVTTIAAKDELDKALLNTSDIALMGDEGKREILNAILKYKRVIILNDKGGDAPIANMMNLFVKDIYNDSLHFFLELIQNADDAAKGIDNASLGIIIEKDMNITFKYNDRGFDFRDLIAITSLGNSTKKAKSDSDSAIGEKGIGFKSIFAIADRVEIKSKHFSFAIRSTDDNGAKKLINIIEPCDVSLDKSEQTELKLVLKEPLKKNDDFISSLTNWAEENIDNKSMANPFMFLKNIREVSFEDKRKPADGQEKKKTIQFEKTRIEDTPFTHLKVQGDEYIIYTEQMKFNKEAIIGRWEHLQKSVGDEANDYCIKREAQVCFPCKTVLGEDVKVKGKVYSYLPTNIEFDMPIFINLDVHLTASRGNISTDDFSKDSAWNKQVEEHLPQFLVNAYEAIVKTHNDGNSYGVANDSLKEIREHLYNYICGTNSSIMYGARLNQFYDDVREKAIYLNSEDKFDESSNVYHIIPEGWEVYKFLERAENLKPYPKTLEWNEFHLKSARPNAHTMSDIVIEQGGIAEREVQVVKEKVFKLLNEELRNYVKSGERLDKLKNCKLMHKDGGEIVSFNEENKPWFFHSSNEAIDEDKDNFLYVDKGVCDSAETFYKNVFGIIEYNLVNFFDGKIDSLPKVEGKIKDEEKIKGFINETFPFFKAPPSENPFSKSQKLGEIVEFMEAYTSEELLEVYDTEEEEAYIEELLNSNFPKWDDSNCDKTYMHYLKFLGLKHSVKAVDGKFDDRSMEILKGLGPIAVEDNKLKPTHLQAYFLGKVNENPKLLENEEIKKFCENVRKKDGIEYVFLKQHVIGSISEQIKKVNDEKGIDLDINASKYYYVSTDYSNIYKDEPDLDKAIKMFITQYSYGDDFYKRLYMLKILNEIFKSKYTWGSKDSDPPLELSVEQFLRCYKYLEEDKLCDLMKKGYKISENGVVKSCLRKDTKDFLKSIDIDIKDDNEMLRYSSNGESPKVIDITASKNEENFLLLVNGKDSENLVAILSDVYEYKLLPYQKKEIQDYYGEVKDAPPKLVKINSDGRNYAAGVVQPEKLPEKLPEVASIFREETLINLCEQYDLNGSEMQGYGEQCPICGRKSHAGLSGMKFKRYIKNEKRFYIVACLSCSNMLSYAKDIEIENFGNIMKKFEYLYVADQDHLKNNSQMITVNLRVTTCDDEVLHLQMKMSYYNMLVYKNQAAKSEEKREIT